MLSSPRLRAFFPALLALCGCQAAAPIARAPLPLIPAEMSVQRTLSAGSVLSGPLEGFTLASNLEEGAEEGAEEAASAEAVDFDLQLFALEKSPAELSEAEGFSALAPRTTVALDPELPRPLLAAAPGLMRGAGVARGAAARTLEQRLSSGELGTHRLAGESSGQLRPGELTRLALTATETPEERDNFLREWPRLGPVEKQLALSLDLQEDGLSSQAAIEWCDIAKPATENRKEEAKLQRPDRPGSALSLQREMVLVELEDGPLRPGEGPLYLLLASPFREAGARSWLARLELKAAAFSERPQSEQQPEAPSAKAQRTPADLQAATLQRAAEQLEFSDQPRAALSYLAAGTGALLAQDLSLSLKDRDWEGYLETFRQEREFRAVAEPTPEELAWVIESASFRYLAKLSDEDLLEPAVEGVLLRHVGALGRFPGTLEELLSEYADLKSFQQRVVFENQVFLEDSSPSDRVRAHDWLGVRDLAVPDYDPLGSRTDRRAALAKAEEIREEALKALADGAAELEVSR